MPAFNEALEWQDRADHARRVAGQLTDPVAKQAMLQAAKGVTSIWQGLLSPLRIGSTTL